MSQTSRSQLVSFHPFYLEKYSKMDSFPASTNSHQQPMTHHMLPPQNRFIYVKNSFFEQPSRVLINPHFKKSVYVNPQFKPKIHVNPNVIKNLVPKNDVKKTTVISTRTKLVRVPCNTEAPRRKSIDKIIAPRKRLSSIHSKYKIVRSRCSGDKVISPRKRLNSIHSKYKIVRSRCSGDKIISPRKRLNSIHSKYKIVRSRCSGDKFKLDRRVKPVKRKFVYVDKFSKTVLKKRSNFVKISGVLYKKSPNSLKLALESSTNRVALKSPKRLSASKTVIKRYTLVRQRKSSVGRSSMRKNNIPCQTYRKFGKCPRKLSGKCFKLHNPDQIILCTRFLQGACLDENCLLSHKVSLEKMPTCKYFLENSCSKDSCPYLHVKISPNADICQDFLQGFCRKGSECNKRHQLLCPDFEKTKKCPRKRCPYPHGNSVRKTKFLQKNVVVKKCSLAKKSDKESESERYYKESKGDETHAVIRTERAKLGQLPAFIPFF